MPRRGCQLGVRDPQSLLLLPLLARAHRHTAILQTRSVDTADVFAYESRLAPRAARLWVLAGRWRRESLAATTRCGWWGGWKCGPAPGGDKPLGPVRSAWRCRLGCRLQPRVRRRSPIPQIDSSSVPKRRLAGPVRRHCCRFRCGRLPRNAAGHASAPAHSGSPPRFPISSTPSPTWLVATDEGNPAVEQRDSFVLAAAPRGEDPDTLLRWHITRQSAAGLRRPAAKHAPPATRRTCAAHAPSRPLPESRHRHKDDGSRRRHRPARFPESRADVLADAHPGHASYNPFTTDSVL